MRMGFSMTWIHHSFRRYGSLRTLCSKYGVNWYLVTSSSLSVRSAERRRIHCWGDHSIATASAAPGPPARLPSPPTSVPGTRPSCSTLQQSLPLLRYPCRGPPQAFLSVRQAFRGIGQTCHHARALSLKLRHSCRRLRRLCPDPRHYRRKLNSAGQVLDPPSLHPAERSRYFQPSQPQWLLAPDTPRR